MRSKRGIEHLRAKASEPGPIFHGKVITKLHDAKTGELIEEKLQYNTVVNASKIGFAKLLNSESGFSGNINYGAAGTGANTPASSDTTLQVEIDRVAVDSIQSSRADNQVTLVFVFSATDANGTLKEFGTFIDGTASADSGTLFNRVNIDVAKTSNQTLTIEVVITVL